MSFGLSPKKLVFDARPDPPMGMGNFKGLSAVKYSATLCVELCNQEYHIEVQFQTTFETKVQLC